MKKQFTIVGLCICLLMAPLTHSNAAAKKFKNCTELNKIYPGGVAIPGAVNKGGVTKQKPTINRALYTANIKSDRDKDGIACER